MKNSIDEVTPIRAPARTTRQRGLDLEWLSDRIALAVGSTASFYAHIAFYGGLFALALAGVSIALILLMVATIVSLEGVFLVIFVQRSANQQAARLDEAIAVIRHNTADHLSEPLDVVVKDIRRELRETTARVAEVVNALQQGTWVPVAPPGVSDETLVLQVPDLLAPTHPEPGGTKKNIDVVVVDDDVTICELVREVLRDSGYAVIAATSGQRAMAILGAYRPRLILADLDMPAMSGWALRAWLRAHEDLQDVPVIVISGSAQIAHEAALLGAHGYIAKPFDIGHLLQLVDAQLLVP